jgi:hypothetical protein
MPLVVLAVIAIAITSLRWQSRRSNDLIDQWAAANNLRILQKESRLMFRGPMFWTTSKNQTVYRITAVDQYGNQRSGWVRCGGWWWGLHSDKITVRWD